MIIGLVINFFFIFNNSNGVVVVDNEIYIGNNSLVNIDVFDCFGIFLWIINNYLILVFGGDDVVSIIFKELNDIIIWVIYIGFILINLGIYIYFGKIGDNINFL